MTIINIPRKRITSDPAFKLEITVGNESVTFPFYNKSGYSYNAIIDYGDGSTPGTITAYNDTDATHTYTAGTYTVSIVGDVAGFTVNNGSFATKLKQVLSFGSMNFYRMNFYGCSNLIFTPNDLKMSNLSNAYQMFSLCTIFNADISNWDVSSINIASYFFEGARAFNQDISNWDVSNLTNADFMFKTTRNFNADISNWDVSSITSMIGMFQDATAFNKNIGNWDISNVTTMMNMFFDSTLSTANYDALLYGWGAQSVKNNVTFHGGNSKYTAGSTAASARAALIADHSWTITDGGTA